MLTEYYMPAPDVMVMVIALSSLTMWRKPHRHSPYSLLKISFCFHLFNNTQLSTCNSMSVSGAALQRFLYLFRRSFSRHPARLRFPLCSQRVAATSVGIAVNCNVMHDLVCRAARWDSLKGLLHCGELLIWVRCFWCQPRVVRSCG